MEGKKGTMHEQFQPLTVQWFKRAFVYTGSIGDFRYRYATDKDVIHAAAYSTYCYEGAGQNGTGLFVDRRGCGGAEKLDAKTVRGFYEAIRIHPHSGWFFFFGHSPHIIGYAQVRLLLACQPCSFYLLPVNGSRGSYILN